MYRIVLLLTLFSSTLALSYELVVEVNDVMDLSSYKQVFKKHFNLSQIKKEHRFIINKWQTCGSDCKDYHIEIYMAISQLPSNMLEEPAYIISFKKKLFLNHRQVKTLQNTFFTVSSSQSKKSTDYYWNENNMVVRQENIFTLLDR